MIARQLLLHTAKRHASYNVEVYLLQDIPTLGLAGQVCEVKPGYARNYLLPKRMAVYVGQDKYTKTLPIFHKGSATKSQLISLDMISREIARLTRGDDVLSMDAFLAHEADKSGTSLQQSTQANDISLDKKPLE